MEHPIIQARFFGINQQELDKKDNYNLQYARCQCNVVNPQDKKLQDQCKQAANANIDLMRQQHANKRLDFEIARLKNCGELMQKGIMFHPKSPYYSVCADVVVMNKNQITTPSYYSTFKVRIALFL